jgi:hypothetical protein
MLVLYATWLAMPWLRSLRYRWIALSALKQIRTEAQDDADILASINMVLRRLANAAYPGEYAASLTNKAWLSFLDQQSGMRGFSEGDGRALAYEHYKPQADARIEAVYKLAVEWVRRHRTRRSSYMHITPVSLRK